MFDATKLLGELMGNQAAPSAAGRLNSAMAQSGLAPTGTAPTGMQAGAEGGVLGSLQSLLGGLGSSGGAGGAAGGGLGGLLGQLVGGVQGAAGTARTEVEANNPMAIGGLGALAGALLGGGKGAVGGGLMAVLGSFAVSALQNSGQHATTALPTAPIPPTQTPSSSPLPMAATRASVALPTTHDEVQANAHLLLRAMISAAKADGQIDAQEMNKIMGKLGETGSDPAAQQFVLQEMGKPLDLAGLAADARTPELAVQVYAASLMAIEVDTPSEERYLASLAQALRLQPTTVTQIHRAMGLSA